MSVTIVIWQKALGAEMNFCPEAELVPLDMIAGICLWHITFYGFNPDEEEETFNNMGEEESSEDGLGTEVNLDQARAMFKQAGQSEKGHGKPERILIKVYSTQVDYVRALPIHESQKEIEMTDEWRPHKGHSNGVRCLATRFSSLVSSLSHNAAPVATTSGESQRNYGTEE